MLSSTNTRNDYVGNGTVDTYSYTFLVFDQSHFTIKVRDPDTSLETTLSLTTHYTVTGVDDPSGGTIALVNGAFDWIDVDGDLEIGWAISIQRNAPLTQLADIRNQGAYFPEVHEDQFDKQIMIAQQQQNKINLSVKLPDTINPVDFSAELPADIAGKSLFCPMTNAAGDGFDLAANWPSGAEIANASVNAIAAAASAAAAASSETSAAASAAAAAAAIQSAFYRDVVYYSFADSPVSVTQAAHNGKLLVFDTSGGAIVVNLPLISSLTPPFNCAALLRTAGNTLTFNRSGPDTIMGATSKTVSTTNVGFQLAADTDGSPDDWSVLDFGTVADNAITAPKIASDAVTTPKILDGNVTFAKLAADVIATITPTSMVSPYAGATAPTGWLLCDGSAISRTTYATLFAVIGTVYGAGDTTTTFNIPDLRGRAVAGQDDMGGPSANRLTNQTGGLDGDVLGATGGAETHSLTDGQTQGHTHGFTASVGGIIPIGGSSVIYDSPGIAAQDHIHSVTGTTGSYSAISDGNPHNNVQPTIILNYIIKT